MSEWTPKRFWKAADVVEVSGGFAVTLDGRNVKTPAKTALVVPTRELAQAIAEEWQAQEDKVDPATMPFTRMSNSALDKVATQFAEVAEMLAAYGDADLLCYRAESPATLVERQNERWNPFLDWATQNLGVRLETRSGLMHAAQDPAALAVLTTKVHQLTPFQLAAFHDLVSLTGSLILGFAATYPEFDIETLWDLSRLDENWQEEQWGPDDEATALANRKKGDLVFAARFYQLATKVA
ncbi:ATP12 family chaperone protein [Pelagimonas varians]|uniref:ATP12 chaperone protein n=1 Tax=Pelagimonas varians TaxID=696760 RepID=A0A238K650_9RHOB|nr:ATP12 family protein [Pelagimonas varians]PYG30340.1 chaperone required for assembly of F1-ATPase [Pelagimonas varians]SMX37914.1 ATP12 chaperone protein [Pelagimonas varians]